MKGFHDTFFDLLTNNFCNHHQKVDICALKVCYEIFARFFFLAAYCEHIFCEFFTSLPNVR